MAADFLKLADFVKGARERGHYLAVTTDIEDALREAAILESQQLRPVPNERDCWVGAPEIFSLQHACLILSEAFGETCYLVGSATHTREFRDVDVRMIFDDDKFKALFGPTENGELQPFWSLLMTAISEYLQKRSGLKVDFQIQKRGSVKESDWDKHRTPLAIYPIDRDPPWKLTRTT